VQLFSLERLSLAQASWLQLLQPASLELSPALLFSPLQLEPQEQLSA
jgi:hypothetical protein